MIPKQTWKRVWIIVFGVLFFLAGDNRKDHIPGGGFVYNCLLTSCPTISVLGKQISELLDDPNEWTKVDYGMWERDGLCIGPLCYPTCTWIVSFFRGGLCVDDQLATKELSYLQQKAHQQLKGN